MAEETTPAPAGLEIWYRPDAIVPDKAHADRVAFWLNAVPSGGSTVEPALRKLNDQEMPEYITNGLAGYPAAQFCERPDYGYTDGYRLSATNTGTLTSDSYTIFLVVRNWSGGANNGGPLMRIWDTTTQFSQELRVGYGGQLDLYSAAGAATNTTQTPQAGVIIEAEFLTNSFASYINGTNTNPQVTHLPGTPSPVPRGLDVGYNYLSTGLPVTNYFGDFQVSEILIYTNSLTADQRNQTGKYLAAKYGLSSAYTSP